LAEIKSKFPTYLFLIFERTNPILWNSSNDSNLDYFILVKDSEIHTILNFFKKSLLTNESYIIDSTAIDVSGYNLNSLFLDLRIVYIYTIYIVNTKIKINILFSQSNHLITVKSGDYFYPNLNWLEREFSEMYGIQLFNKNDFRKLLLNYCDSFTPLKRDYVSRGDMDFYYNFQDRQVISSNSSNVEL
jgi:NADH:ubiquinone oxidoreductase subunit C